MLRLSPFVLCAVHCLIGTQKPLRLKNTQLTLEVERLTTGNTQLTLEVDRLNRVIESKDNELEFYKPELQRFWELLGNALVKSIPEAKEEVEVKAKPSFWARFRRKRKKRTP